VNQFGGDVRFEDVWKLFGHDQYAIANLNLVIERGEFLVLVGPSGCGKTTSLRILAGLERPTYGRIWFGERDATVLPPGERDVAMVFQSYALYPNMSVYKNLAFGPTVRGDPKRDSNQRIREVAEILEIETLLDRRPTQLSGGQRQRVALGRALLRQPHLFLLDEPLSNLDAALRVQMRAELIRLHRRLPDTTTVYVTHDQVEALTMGDRVVVLKDGEVMQVDTPSALYDNPANVFVGTFVGSPKMNMADGLLVEDDRKARLRLFGTDVGLHPTQARMIAEGISGRTVHVGLRPADVGPAGEASRGDQLGRIRGVVDVVEHLGSEIFATVRVETQTIVARFPRNIVPRAGTTVELTFDPRHLYFFNADTGSRVIDRAIVLREFDAPLFDPVSTLPTTTPI
jgi:multiple sugar transport system ATP-binding protein